MAACSCNFFQSISIFAARTRTATLLSPLTTTSSIHFRLRRWTRTAMFSVNKNDLQFLLCLSSIFDCVLILASPDFLDLFRQHFIRFFRVHLPLRPQLQFLVFQSVASLVERRQPFLVILLVVAQSPLGPDVRGRGHQTGVDPLDVRKTLLVQV